MANTAGVHQETNPCLNILHSLLIFFYIIINQSCFFHHFAIVCNGTMWKNEFQGLEMKFKGESKNTKSFILFILYLLEKFRYRFYPFPPSIKLCNHTWPPGDMCGGLSWHLMLYSPADSCFLHAMTPPAALQTHTVLVSTLQFTAKRCRTVVAWGISAWEWRQAARSWRRARWEHTVSSAKHPPCCSMEANSS